MADGFLTAPIGRSDLVLATIPLRDERTPETDTLAALADPCNYAHVLDLRDDITAEGGSV